MSYLIISFGQDGYITAQKLYKMKIPFMVLYGENTQYRIKLKKLIARARAQWPLGTGVWATAGLGRALSAVSHTHTPARPGRPRRPPRGVSASAVPRAAATAHVLAAAAAGND